MKKEMLICGLASILATPSQAEFNVNCENKSTYGLMTAELAPETSFNAALFNGALYAISKNLEQTESDFTDEQVKELYRKASILKEQLQNINSDSYREFQRSLIWTVFRQNDLVQLDDEEREVITSSLLDKLKCLGIVSPGVTNANRSLCL